MLNQPLPLDSLEPLEPLDPVQTEPIPVNVNKVNTLPQTRSELLAEIKGGLSGLIGDLQNPQISPQADEFNRQLEEETRGIFVIQGAFQEMYRSLGVLGRGCSGVVKKVQCRETRLKYACKIVRTQDEEMIATLKTEFKRVSSLSHPGVIKFHKLLIDPMQGMVYLIMELFDGITLEEFSTSLANMTPEDALLKASRVFKEVSSIVAYLHARGVSHRDVHPGNILINAGKFKFN